MRIIVFGMGYVGTSLGLVLAQNNTVSLVDIDQIKIKNFNEGLLPIEDSFAQEFFNNNDLNIQAFSYSEIFLSKVDLVIIATPTDFDEKLNSFDTSTVETVIFDVKQYSSQIPILIKSTIPVGFTERQNYLHRSTNIYFSPEFLSEGNAVQDNLYPTRIIIGGDSDYSEMVRISHLFKEAASVDEVLTSFCGSREAESIKIFTNTFLAMRVAFFNEIDSVCAHRNLDVRSVIDGLCLDKRIGDYYNNPSFGFGGYCLPKDSKQAEIEVEQLSAPLLKNISYSNYSRKLFICDQISNRNKKVIGIYKLAMKSGSDNYRSSAILDIIEILSERGMELLIFDGSLNCNEFRGHKVIKDIDEFKSASDIIVSNRMDDEIIDCVEKVYTRDLYGYL